MKLPDLDFKEDIEKYEAKEEKKNIEFRNCKHKETFLSKNKEYLLCKCGSAWSGSRLQELQQLLTKGK